MHSSSGRRRWLALLAAALVTVAALLPGGDASLPALGPLGLVGADKYAHALGFAVVALLAAWAVPADDRRRLVGVAVVAIALGVAIELAQGVVPGRTPDALDALADAVGVLVGLAVDRFRRR